MELFLAQKMQEGWEGLGKKGCDRRERVGGKCLGWGVFGGKTGRQEWKGGGFHLIGSTNRVK